MAGSFRVFRFRIYWRKFRLIESKGYTKGLYFKRVDDIANMRGDDRTHGEEAVDNFIERMIAKTKCGLDEWCLTWLKHGQYMNPHELSLLSRIMSGGLVDATFVKDWIMDRL